MPKVIRATYPAQFSIGVLLLIFIVSALLSFLIFDTPFHELTHNRNVIGAMLLVGFAVDLMLLIIWEELLFPVRVKEIPGGVLLRNHRTKLKTQAALYSVIPAIFIYIFLNFQTNLISFIIYSSICTLAPIIEKLASGLKNYNDFLKLTNTKIEFKDNEQEGEYFLEDIQSILILKDSANVIQKIHLSFKNHDEVIINVYQMELEAFYEIIRSFILTYYKHLVKETIIEKGPRFKTVQMDN